MRNISIQLCLKELYTYSKSSFYSLIIRRYPDNYHVCIILENKIKPVFNTYSFHSYVCMLLLLARNSFCGGFPVIKESFGYLQPEIGTLMFCIIFVKWMQVGDVSLSQNRFSKNISQILFNTQILGLDRRVLRLRKISLNLIGKNPFLRDFHEFCIHSILSC